MFFVLYIKATLYLFVTSHEPPARGCGTGTRTEQGKGSERTVVSSKHRIATSCAMDVFNKGLCVHVIGFIIDFVRSL